MVCFPPNGRRIVAKRSCPGFKIPEDEWQRSIEYDQLLQTKIAGRYGPEPGSPLQERPGRYGVVCALDEKTGDTVHLKVAHKSRMDQDLIRRDFEIGQDLCHENLLRYHELVDCADYSILVLEYSDALPLEPVDRFFWRRPLVRNQVGLTIFHELQAALDYLHERGIVHGDLKPQNVLVSRSGGVKVTVFSGARVMNRELPDLKRGDDDQLLYGSPEHSSGRLIKESDYFAVGTLLFEYLNARHPFWRLGPEFLFREYGNLGAQHILAGSRLHTQERCLLQLLFSSSVQSRGDGWEMLRTLKYRRFVVGWPYVWSPN